MAEDHHKSTTLMQLEIALSKRIVIATAVMSVLIFLVWFFGIPNPNMILISGLVMCSALFGFGGGIVAAVIMFGYTLFFFSADHSFIRFSPENLMKVGTSLIGIVADMLFVCFLKTAEMRAFREISRLTGQLRQQKESVTTLLNHMPVITFSKDAENGIYLACNQAFADYAGKDSPEGVMGLSDEEIFDRETARHFTADDRTALAMDKPHVFFEDVQDTAGNRRQFQTTKLKFRDPSGKQCLLGMSLDVTELERIRQEKAAAREAYEKARVSGIMFTHIAQSLARGYTELFYVNLDTQEFSEYHTDEDGSGLAEVRRGQHFFAECQNSIRQQIYPDDRENISRLMNRDTLLANLNKTPHFMVTHRIIKNGAPSYVSMKISRMKDDDRFAVIGITNIDEQIKHQRAMEQIREDHVAYTRLSALAGDFVCVYVVNPATDAYREYRSPAKYEDLCFPKEGLSFFEHARQRILDYIFPEDLKRFLSLFVKEGIMAEISRSGMFALSYRLIINDAPAHVLLKAVMVEETEGPRLIVGVINVQSQVRQEEEYRMSLAQAREAARIDPLTGLKNRHAYLEEEEQIDREIAGINGIPGEHAPELALAIMDLNDLKEVNDRKGHQAGDQYIREAAGIIAGIFRQGRIFRIGGDEFLALVRGADSARMGELLQEMQDHNDRALRDGGVVIACGAARLEGDPSLAPVFQRADKNMYADKKRLKAARII